MKDYGTFSFARNMGKRLDHAKKFATDAINNIHQKVEIKEQQ